MHISGQQVVFEVYNPFSILQLSEVLRDFKIVIGKRELYTGNAVVSSLVNRGIMMVVEATLTETWVDVDAFSILEDRTLLNEELHTFIKDWEVSQDLIPEFKVLINDYRSFFEDLSLWLTQVEVNLKNLTKDAMEQVVGELVDAVSDPIRPVMVRLMQRMEELARDVPAEDEGLYRTYTRRALHPVTLCSPFVHRTYTKPLGYAGDYEMINMILSDGRRGESLFAKTLNALILEAAPAAAHRNRVIVLRDYLERETRRQADQGQTLRVLNVACGPAKEVRDFVTHSPLADHCEMTLLDFSKEALGFAESATRELIQGKQSKMELHVIHKSADQLLRESVGQTPGQSIVPRRYDYVYCAGLFDYLTDSVCQRLISLFYNWTEPGGMTLVTNIHPANPVKGVMDYLLEWNVLHRDEEHFKRLSVVDGAHEIYCDDTGVNLFMTIRKPTAPSGTESADRALGTSSAHS